MKKRLLFTVMFICCAIFSIYAQGENPVSTEDALREAITDAIGEVTITIGNDIVISGSIKVDEEKKITIEGQGKILSVTEPGVSAYRIFEVDGEGSVLNLKDLTLEGGDLGDNDNGSSNGGAISVTDKASLVLECVTITKAKGYYGGGIYVYEGFLEVKGASEFTDNEAYNRGGAIYVESANANIGISSESKFDSNKAKVAGGALYLALSEGEIKIGDDSGSPVQFSANTALSKSRGGGAVFITQAHPEKDLTITIKADFQENQCLEGTGCNYTEEGKQGCFDRQGGACYIYGGSLLTVKEGSVFNKNRADGGGAMYLHEVKEAVFEEGILFTENSGIYAGAICFYKSEVEINKATFAGNFVTGNGQKTDNGNGSAIFNEETKLTIKGSTFDNNRIEHTNKTGGMGAISSVINCDLTLQDCTFSNNKSIYGGAVVNGSKLTIIDCDFQDNTATLCGGAVYNYYQGELTITNTLIAGNKADAGGGLFSGVGDERAIVLTNVTMADNVATTTGGGVYIGGKVNLTIDNSIVWGNIANDGNIINKTDDIPITYTNSLVEDITDDQNGNLEGIPANKPIFVGESGGDPYYDLDINNPYGILNMGVYAPNYVYLVYHSNFGTDQSVAHRFSSETTSETVKSYQALEFTNRSGYRFLNWNDEANRGGTAYRTGETINLTDGNIYHLYAQWSRIETDPDPEPEITTYSITYEANAGGELTVTYQGESITSGASLNAGSSVTVTATPTFAGVVLESLTVNGTKIESGSTVVINSNTQIIAHFTLDGEDPDPDPENPTGNAVIDDALKVWSATGQLHIETAAPTDIMIYSVTGKLMGKYRVNGMENITMPASVYIVKAGTETRKIVVAD